MGSHTTCPNSVLRSRTASTEYWCLTRSFSRVPPADVLLAVHAPGRSLNGHGRKYVPGEALPSEESLQGRDLALERGALLLKPNNRTPPRL